MGEGDHKVCAGNVSNSCRMGEIEGVRTVELVYIGRLLRMGCDSLLMPLCGSVEGGFTGKWESDV